MANGQTNISGGKTLVGTAKPSDVRMGMTYPDGKKLRNGTLDLRNLKPENIKSGVTIGGVSGALASLFEDNIEIVSDSTSYYHRIQDTELYLLLLGYQGHSIIVNDSVFMDIVTKIVGYGGAPLIEILKLKNLKIADRIYIPKVSFRIKSVVDRDIKNHYSDKVNKSYEAYEGGRVFNIQHIRNDKQIDIAKIKQGTGGKVYWSKFTHTGDWRIDHSSGNRANLFNLDSRFIERVDHGYELIRRAISFRARMRENDIYDFIDPDYLHEFDREFYDVISIFFKIK